MNNSLKTIRGEITRVKRFDTGYTILSVLPEKSKDSPHLDADIIQSSYGVTLIGNMPQFAEGMVVEAKGTAIEHPKYGWQYKVEEIKECGFNREDALVQYLSKAFSGIGMVLARNIVKHFGLDTLSILDADANRISEVSGISASKVDKFIEQWQGQRLVHQAMSTLMGYGMTMGMALKVFKHFGNTAVQIIENNPYQIIEITGIGFHKADEVALRLGIPRNSVFRIKAAIRYILDNVMWAQGHCYLINNTIITEAIKLLQIDVSHLEVSNALKELEQEGVIISEGNRIYLTHVYYAEQSIAKTIKEMLKYNDQKIYNSIEQLRADIKIYEIQNEIELAPEQEDAIFTIMNSRICVITGSPGTGKSTLLKAACELFKIKDIEFELCSPTGRASKRLSEATGYPAATIHRMLGYVAGGFEHNSTNPLDTDCVIVDETSMIDILLFRDLLDALEYDSRLILVGDADQLASVGPGNVLHDLIESEIIPVVKLTKIFRQDKNSTIITVAHDILNGIVPKLESPAKSKGKNCMLVACEDKDKLISYVLDLVGTHLPNAGFKADDIQILTPMREKGLGVHDLNPKLQELLNPPSPDKDEIKVDFKTWRIGDRMMQLRNDYNKDVFNGDIGILAAITRLDTGIKIYIRYPDKENLIEYEQSDWDDLQLVYGMTIHKAQGGEYPVVILVLHPSHYVMLQRNLLYTGLTRARKMCIIAGTPEAIETAVHNDKIQKRNTTLKQRLMEVKK